MTNWTRIEAEPAPESGRYRGKDGEEAGEAWRGHVCVVPLQRKSEIQRHRALAPLGMTGFFVATRGTVETVT